MFLRDKGCQHHLLFSIIQPCKTIIISNFQQCVFVSTGNKPSKMCKKRYYVRYPFFGTEHFKKCLILVYPFQEKKNVYSTSWELSLEKRVLPVKIISVCYRGILSFSCLINQRLLCVAFSSNLLFVVFGLWTQSYWLKGCFIQLSFLILKFPSFPSSKSWNAFPALREKIQFYMIDGQNREQGGKVFIFTHMFPIFQGKDTHFANAKGGRIRME